MLKGTVLLVVLVAECYAGTVPAGQGVYCGYIPKQIFSCIGSPVLNPAGSAVVSKCSKSDLECDTYTCIFRGAGWMDGDRINKKNATDYFERYATEHAAWIPAINHLKAACLGDRDIPAQGVNINCPAYDLAHCALTSFVKFATPDQWRSSTECQQVQTYAANCPICPDSCFTSQVPIGACNACLSLPRSA